MTDIDITINASFLPQDDPDAAVAFYRDILGFEIRSTSATAVCAGSRSGRPASRDVDRPVSAGRRPWHHRRRAPHHRRDDGEGHLRHHQFATHDLDDTFAQLQAGGAEVVQEPTEQPYGIRDCAFRDPAGNLIRINQLR